MKLSRRIFWIIISAIVVALVAFSFDHFVKPIILPPEQIKIELSASRTETGSVKFRIKNAGDAAAKDLKITIWAASVFTARTDILNVKHIGGTIDASASNYEVSEQRFTGDKGRPNVLNTVAQAAVIKFPRINGGEKWHGHLEYAVMKGVATTGLVAHVKGEGISENPLCDV